MDLPPAFAGRIRNWIWEAGLLLVLPLAFCHGFAEQFTTPKLFLAKCLVISGIAVWALEWVWRCQSRPRRSLLVLPLLAFSLAVLLSCLASPVPRFSLMEVEFALCGPAWVLLLHSWERGSSAVHRVMALVGLAGALAAVVTLLQRLGFDPMLLGGYRVEWGSLVERMRLYSTFGNPNFVGGYLIGAIFTALALALASPARWARALGWSSAVLMLSAIVLTGSRGAWLGLALGCVAAAGMLLPSDVRPRAVPPSSASMKMSPIPLAWPLGILTLSLAQRLAAQLRGRAYLWRFSWPLFWKHPIVGSGWGVYQLLYLDLQGRFLAAHPDYVRYWSNNRLVHNDPLQMLLEAGLLGLAAFLWVLWAYGREALAVRRDAVGAWPRGAAAASVGAVAAILADSLFNYQFAVPPTYILLFTFLGVPGLLRAPDVQEQTGERSSPGSHAPRTAGRLALQCVASAAILAAPGGLCWQQVRALQAERLYQAAMEREDHDDLDGAQSAFRRSVALNELNGRAHFGLSRVLYEGGSSTEALQEIVCAEQTYADSHEEVLRARILDQMGMAPEALAAYRHALWLDPTLVTVQEDIERLSRQR